MDERFNKSIQQFIKSALDEDVGAGDYTSLACIDVNAVGKAIVRTKDNGIVAGVAVAEEVLKNVDPHIVAKTLVKDGDEVTLGQVIIEIEGNVQSILKAERLLLNFMQRMSGIATKTNQLVKVIKGTGCTLLDTRKTTPNFRMFEKWAVRIGGASNHRFGLYDMILIKNNHIDACGGIENAISSARNYLKAKNLDLKIEIETRSIDELKEVLNVGGINRIMLDNFSIQNLSEAVMLIDRRFETEASGGITEENIREIAETGVDFISMGSLTHSYKSLDIHLKLLIS